jgi:hypothetical protein
MESKAANTDWFAGANQKLATIEEHRLEYEDEEEGDKAPPPEVFAAAKQFLEALHGNGDNKFDEPRMFVAPNGNLVLAFGNKTRGFDIRFAPEVTFFYKTGDHPNQTGTGVADAVKVLNKHFQL